MKKFTKWLALLMAGLLLSATLIACDDSYDWSESDEDDDEEQSESDSGSSQYKNLAPEEIWDELLKADDFTIEMEGTSSSGDEKSTVLYTITKDGDLLQLTMKNTYGTQTQSQSAYYDLKNNRAYEEENGEWYYQEGDEDDIDLSDLMDDLLPVDLLFDAECYKEYDSENRNYEMKADAIAEELNAPEDVVCEGKMTSKGSTYTFTISASNEDRSVGYNITVKFTADTVKLPDAKPVENEGTAIPDVEAQ